MRKQLEAAVEQSYAYERTTCPMLQGDGYYYWLYNPGTSPRDVLVKSKDLARHFGKPPSADGIQDGPALIFDPNAEADTSLYMHSWSPSGRYWAAILQKAGSDWQDIRVIDTVTCKAVEADLTGAKFTFGATWINETVGRLLDWAHCLPRLIGCRDSCTKQSSAGQMARNLAAPTVLLATSTTASTPLSRRMCWCGTEKDPTEPA